MNLFTLGWSSYDSSSSISTSNLARITAIYGSSFQAHTAEKEIKLYPSHQVPNFPAVGDWVRVTPEFQDENGNPASVLQEILARKTCLSRWSNRGEQVIATNIDTAFIVTSSNQDFSLNRLQRFLLLIKKSKATPVIVLSKTDLLENHQDLKKEIQEKLSVQVLGTSLVHKSGIEELRKLMPPGSTSVFLGTSGVGKSSLVNALLGSKTQTTQEIRLEDAKGKHTTTARQMFFVPEYGVIIDTPGVREVQIFGDQEDLEDTFPKITELARSCRFTNCTHQSEPDCAISKALQNGEIESEEWQNYLKLQKEIAFSHRKQNKEEMSNTKKKWRDINVMMRKRRKFEGR